MIVSRHSNKLCKVAEGLYNEVYVIIHLNGGRSELERLEECLFYNGKSKQYREIYKRIFGRKRR